VVVVCGTVVQRTGWRSSSGLFGPLADFDNLDLGKQEIGGFTFTIRMKCWTCFAFYRV